MKNITFLETVLRLLSCSAVVLAALIAALGGLAKTWFEDYLERRREDGESKP